MTQPGALGTCLACHRKLSRTGMGRHVAGCLASHEAALPKGSTRAPALVVNVTGGGPFWLCLACRADGTLADIDGLLRDVWLECCGHLSEFRVDGVRYGTPEEDDWFGGPPVKDSRTPLAVVAATRPRRIEYDYDFGSTTSLRLSIGASADLAFRRKEACRLLARNDEPVLTCEHCRKAVAKLICPYCGGVACRGCRRRHGCEGGDSLLPLVNSPRTGVCAYGTPL